LPFQRSISCIGTGGGRAEARPYHNMSTRESPRTAGEIDPQDTRITVRSRVAHPNRPSIVGRDPRANLIVVGCGYG
jgi:hypothetical protein